MIVTVETQKIVTIEAALLSQGLVDIRALDPSIVVKLAYSGTNNFMHHDAYGELEKAFMVPEAAAMLTNAQAILKESHPLYSLIVYDAARPNSVQWTMWEIVKDTPLAIYVADPGKGSLHNYGAAVDLSIVGPDGLPLDMGTPFDGFTDLSQPKYEEKFLKQNLLSHTQLSNRLLLREVMTKAGFLVIPNEWWHFNAFPKDVIKKKFKMIQ
ncbi:MAG: hypothetical protein A2Y33_08170 [Spirochaetes bacterium GWF1_51_8]|nr:MAG: hypothetical protein A2Y33_08170 [Spirochaetes bacterium GWF1_51_8]